MGTLWGTCREVAAFFDDLLNELKNCQRPYNVINDQGSANVLIYYRKKFADILRPSNNYDDDVITVGLTASADMKIKYSQGLVLNGKGKIAAVVHQYDRKARVVRLVLRRYSQGMSEAYKAELRSHYTFPALVKKFFERKHKGGFVKDLVHVLKRLMFKTKNPSKK